MSWVIERKGFTKRELLRKNQEHLNWSYLFGLGFWKISILMNKNSQVRKTIWILRWKKEVCFVIVVAIVCFVGHTWWCSMIIPSFLLRIHSWQCSVGYHMRFQGSNLVLPYSLYYYPYDPLKIEVLLIYLNSW